MKLILIVMTLAVPSIALAQKLPGNFTCQDLIDTADGKASRSNATEGTLTFRQKLTTHTRKPSMLYTLQSLIRPSASRRLQMLLKRLAIWSDPHRLDSDGGSS